MKFKMMILSILCAILISSGWSVDQESGSEVELYSFSQMPYELQEKTIVIAHEQQRRGNKTFRTTGRYVCANQHDGKEKDPGKIVYFDLEKGIDMEIIKANYKTCLQQLMIQNLGIYITYRKYGWYQVNESTKHRGPVAYVEYSENEVPSEDGDKSTHEERKQGEG